MLDADPRITQIRHALENRPAQVVPRADGTREAAVAVIVRPRDALEVLLIRRALLHGDPWSGHVAFPGGRRDPDDPDLLATACREADEEVGIPLQRIGTLVGVLDELGPSSPLLPPVIVTPFVMAVPPDTTAHPDPREVQAAIWAPLDALRDDAASATIEVEHGALRRTFPSLVYGDYEVWGLTYRILEQFLELTGTAGG
jgi:8-oxo-dGTP pyrophosphatase MutT (NUDIX family)